MRLALSVMFLLSTLTASAWADSLDDCADVADPTARLACYDAAAGRAPTPHEPAPVVRTAPTPSATARTPAPSADAESEATFGVQATEPPMPKRIETRLTRHAVNGFGKWTFWLENGQIWKQTDTKPLRIVKSKEPDVLITKHVLGSYKLKLAGNRAVSAKRIQ